MPFIVKYSYRTWDFLFRLLDSSCCWLQHGRESDNRSSLLLHHEMWHQRPETLKGKLYFESITGNWNLAGCFCRVEEGSSPTEGVLLLSPTPGLFSPVSTWTCTDTAGSSWWKGSWTMTCLKSRTCPTSTRRTLTAATTELWPTGSASWSRDSWLSSPSARWCVSVRSIGSWSWKHPRCQSVVVFVQGEDARNAKCRKLLLKGFTSPRGVLLTFVSAEPH